jgi:hypothetical protein
MTLEDRLTKVEGDLARAKRRNVVVLVGLAALGIGMAATATSNGEYDQSVWHYPNTPFGKSPEEVASLAWPGWDEFDRGRVPWNCSQESEPVCLGFVVRYKGLWKYFGEGLYKCNISQQGKVRTVDFRTFRGTRSRV